MNHTKTYKESNTLFAVIYKHHGLNYFGLSYWKGIAHAHNYSIHMHYPSSDIHKTFGLHNIYLEFGRVLHSLNKT